MPALVTRESIKIGIVELREEWTRSWNNERVNE